MAANLRCVVVAVDGSDESISALRWGLENVTVRSPENGGSFVILHVQPRPSIAVGINPAFGGPSTEVPDIMEAVEAHQKRVTEAIFNRALEICALNNVNAKTHLVVGNPKYKICEVVDEMQADMLLMGNRAFGRIKRTLCSGRMFLGSVSKYCSNHASCPVVIVKADSKQPLQAYDSQ